MHVTNTLLSGTLIFYFFLFFQSCNTEGITNEHIIGSWKVQQSNQEFEEYYSFDSNGGVYKFIVYDSDNAELEGPKGSFAISERSIHLVFDDQGYFYDYMFDGDTLYLEKLNEEIVLIKVGELDLAYLPIF